MIEYDFQAGLRVLALARHSLEMAKQEKAKISREIERREDWKQFSEVEAKAKADIETWDKVLRGTAVEVYKETNEKQVNQFIEIRITKKIEYPMEMAIAWCWTSMPGALNINKSLFEKHARAVEETTPLPFVTITETPQATIASDLSELIKEA